MTKDLKMYILVNEDIKLSKGKLAGQVGHAVSSYMYHADDLNFLMNINEYMNGLQKKIILKCPQEKLEILEKENFIAIRDAGLTHLEPGTLTCVNMGILDDKSNNPYMDFIKGLRLL